MGKAYRALASEEDRIKAGLALQLVAASTGVTMETMTAQERLGVRACRARRLAMYLAHVAFGWQLERVGHAFGLNRATVAQACRWAEDERERPIIDALLDRLEGCVHLVFDVAPSEAPV